MSVNKVILIGRLGRDPEMRYTPSGTAVCSYSIATNETWTDKDGQRQERTEWHRIVVWGKQGERCNQYLSKGKQVFIEGRLQTNSWEDREGQKRYTTEVVAQSVRFLDAPSSEASGDFAGGSNFQNTRQESAPSAQGDSSMMDKDYSVSSDQSFTADDIPF